MNKYQYYTDGKEKVRRVIESCETKEQLKVARKYLRLFESGVKEMFSREDPLYKNIRFNIVTLDAIITARKIRFKNKK